MGCRHSTSSTSPSLRRKSVRTDAGRVLLKSKISVQRTQVIKRQISNENPSLSTSQLSIVTKKTCMSLPPPPPPPLPLIGLSLEQTLNGHETNLIKRFQLNTTSVLFDISKTHTLLLDGRQLRLINMETMNIQTNSLPLDCGDIQEIAWSSKLNVFLLLTTDRLYQTNTKHLHPIPISQIQFIAEGPRKSYMAVNGNDLLINRCFGYDIRRYKLSNLSLVQSPRAYTKNREICITNIRLNSEKVLALAIAFGKKQFIDLVQLNTDQLLYRIHSKSNENILYPVDLHDHSQWFAKTCIPNTNIGHCLVSSNGQIIRLKLFPNQDNFIRIFCMSAGHRWLGIVRQNTLEIYQPCTSL